MRMSLGFSVLFQAPVEVTVASNRWAAPTSSTFFFFFLSFLFFFFLNLSHEAVWGICVFYVRLYS